jgi:ribosomal protein L23
MKPRVFFFHYNKPLSVKRNKPVISLHYKNKCMMVDNVVLNTKTWGCIRKTQPRFVVKGKATKIEIKNGIAYIY